MIFLFAILLQMATQNCLGAEDVNPILKAEDLPLLHKSVEINKLTFKEISNASSCPSDLKIKPINVLFPGNNGKPKEMQILPLSIKDARKDLAGGWKIYNFTFLQRGSLRKQKWQLRIKDSGPSADFYNPETKSNFHIEGFASLTKQEEFKFAPSDRICERALPKTKSTPTEDLVTPESNIQL